MTRTTTPAGTHGLLAAASDFEAARDLSTGEVPVYKATEVARILRNRAAAAQRATGVPEEDPWKAVAAALHAASSKALPDSTPGPMQPVWQVLAEASLESSLGIVPVDPKPSVTQGAKDLAQAIDAVMVKMSEGTLSRLEVIDAVLDLITPVLATPVRPEAFARDLHLVEGLSPEHEALRDAIVKMGKATASEGYEHTEAAEAMEYAHGESVDVSRAYAALLNAEA